MILKILLSIVLGAVAFTLGGPVLYYFWVGPQSAAALTLAKESEDELKRLGDTKNFSREDYRASMQRIREREARYREILTEKRRIRRRTWQIAIVSGLATCGVGLAGLVWLPKRLRAKAITAPTAESQ